MSHVRETSREWPSYDTLYRGTPGLLWGAQPGRLVRRIREWSDGGHVLDAGCGDGKNAAHLIQLGFTVEGFDISALAIERLQQRVGLSCDNSTFAVQSCGDYLVSSRGKSYDALVSYGLFHCLPPSDRVQWHSELLGLVRPGGVALFTTLTDEIPLAPDHQTPGIQLADLTEVDDLFGGEWRVLHRSVDYILEEHPPTVGLHRHSAIWVVARRHQ